MGTQDNRVSIHENKIRGGSELKQMLGICDMNLISLQHDNDTGIQVFGIPMVTV